LQHHLSQKNERGEILKPQPQVWHSVEGFDCLIKQKLKYKARSFFAQEEKRAECDLLFSEVSPVDLLKLTVADDYFNEYYIFRVLDLNIGVSDEDIAEALCELPRHKRKVVLLYYFMDMKDPEIAEFLNLKKTTVSYRRNSGKKLLKKILEEKGYG